MNNNKSPHFNLAKHWAWFFYISIFCITYLYISEDAYKIVTLSMPKSQYSMWHDIYYQLSNGIEIPFQHWIGLFLLFFQYMTIQTMPNMLLRYSNKTQWYWKSIRALWGIAFKTVALGYLLMFGMSFIRFGLPHSITFGNYVPCAHPIPVMLVTSFLCRLNISCFTAIIFLLITIWKNNGIISYLVCIVYMIIVHVVLWITPPFISFKRIVFASCFTYHYISDGYYLENVFNAFGLPLIFGLIGIWISYNLLDGFPERGKQQ